MATTHNSISRLSSNVRNAERNGLGRNAEASSRTAQMNYRHAVEFVVRQEDEHGVEAATPVAMKVQRLRDRAIAAGLMGRIQAASQDRLAIIAVTVEAERVAARSAS